MIRDKKASLKRIARHIVNISDCLKEARQYLSQTTSAQESLSADCPEESDLFLDLIQTSLDIKKLELKLHRMKSDSQKLISKVK